MMKELAEYLLHRISKALDNMEYILYSTHRKYPIFQRIGIDQMPNYDVIFYEKPDGTEPAKEFLLSLDPKMRAKMLKTIDLLAENGNELREPYSKYLEDSIFELRAKVGSDISRVLYFFFVGKRVVLTNGFIKKTQKTPTGEKERAKQYRKDYMEREGEQT